jgi:hypothetical protein
MTEYEVRMVFRVTEENSGMEDQIAERAWSFIEQTMEPTSIDTVSVNELPPSRTAEIIQVLFPRGNSGK